MATTRNTCTQEPLAHLPNLFSVLTVITHKYANSLQI